MCGQAKCPAQGFGCREKNLFHSRFFLHTLGDDFVPNNNAAHRKNMGAVQGVSVRCLRADRSAPGQKLGELHPQPTSDEGSTV